MQDKSRLLIYTPDLFIGDAIGNYCFGVSDAGRRLGMSPILFAQRKKQSSEKEKILHIDQIFEIVGNNDILFINFSIYDSYLTKLLGLNCKKIVYFHGITPPELLRKYDEATAQLCELGLEQMPDLQCADLLVANSKLNKDILKKLFPKKIVEILPPLFSHQGIFSQDYKNSYTRHNDSKVRILYVGRVMPHKGLEDLLTLLSNLKKLKFKRN